MGEKRERARIKKEMKIFQDLFLFSDEESKITEDDASRGLGEINGTRLVRPLDSLLISI